MSKNFRKVRDYYQRKLWSITKVHNMVGVWITAEEYQLITGEEYEE